MLRLQRFIPAVDFALEVSYIGGACGFKSLARIKGHLRNWISATREAQDLLGRH